MYVFRNMETPSCNHCCGRKAINIMYCVCATIVIQHGNHVHHIVNSGLPNSTIISTLSQKDNIFQKNNIYGTKIGILIPSIILSEIFIFMSRTERHATKNAY